MVIMVLLANRQYMYIDWATASIDVTCL